MRMTTVLVTMVTLLSSITSQRNAIMQFCAYAAAQYKFNALHC